MDKLWKVVDILNIKIIGVGKLKEKYFKAGIAEYAKRLGRYCKFEIVEVPDEKAPESLSQAEMDEVMSKEGERILDKIKDREYVYALAIKGKERSSEEFAKESRCTNLVWTFYLASSINAFGFKRTNLSCFYHY